MSAQMRNFYLNYIYTHDYQHLQLYLFISISICLSDMGSPMFAMNILPLVNWSMAGQNRARCGKLN